MVERAIGIQEDLGLLASNVLQLRHKLLQMAAWQGK